MIAKTIIKIAQVGVHDAAQLWVLAIAEHASGKAASVGDLPTDHTRSNNMTPHISEEFFTRLIDWSPFVIMGNSMPPRDPDEDEEDQEDEEDEDRTDEPPVVREPDEDQTSR